MDSFTIYSEAYVITGGDPGVSTVFLSHELVQTGLIQFDLGEAGAMAVIYFLMVVFVSAIFYRLIAISLQNPGEVAGAFPLVPVNPTLGNFKLILSDPDLDWGYVTLIYLSIIVFISVGVAIPVAYAFSRFQFRGDRLLFFSLLMFRMTVPAILLVPFVQIFSALGLIDTAYCSGSRTLLFQFTDCDLDIGGIYIRGAG